VATEVKEKSLSFRMSDSSRATLGRIVRLAVVGLLVVVAATGPAAAHSGDDGGHHHDGWMGTHDGMGAWWWGGFLWLALLAGGLLVGAYLLTTRQSAGDGGTDQALSALRERYARGDIDEEEFERRRQTLLEAEQ